jgi:hypothetical protein
MESTDTISPPKASASIRATSDFPAPVGPAKKTDLFRFSASIAVIKTEPRK